MHGALAQLGAPHTGSVGVTGSSPVCSTRLHETLSAQVLRASLVRNIAERVLLSLLNMVGGTGNFVFELGTGYGTTGINRTFNRICG